MFLVSLFCVEQLINFVIKHLPSNIGFGPPRFDKLDPAVGGAARWDLLLAEDDGLRDGEEQGHDPRNSHKSFGHFERVPVQVVSNSDCTISVHRHEH